MHANRDAWRMRLIIETFKKYIEKYEKEKIIENMLSVILAQGICLRQIRAFCLRLTPTARLTPIA